MTISSEVLSCHSFGIRNGMREGLHGQAVDMFDLAAELSLLVDRPVVDKTNLQGLYDIQTDGWSPELPLPVRSDDPSVQERTLSDPLRPTLFGVLEQLGLRLEPVNGVLQVLVIDSVAMPDPN